MGLYEPGLAWLRLGVREVSVGDWLFNFNSNFKLLGQLFWLFSSFNFFNSNEILSSVVYMYNAGASMS